MPFFSFSITIPYATTEEDPYTQDLTLIRGIIHYLAVYFPPGSQGEAHVRIFRKGSQIFPWNAEETARGDESTVGPPREWIELEEPPYMLTMEGTNDNETENRGVVIHIGILPREILLPEKRLTDYLIAFLRRFKVPIG